MNFTVKAELIKVVPPEWHSLLFALVLGKR